MCIRDRDTGAKGTRSDLQSNTNGRHRKNIPVKPSRQSRLSKRASPVRSPHKAPSTSTHRLRLFKDLVLGFGSAGGLQDSRSNQRPAAPRKQPRRANRRTGMFYMRSAVKTAFSPRQADQRTVPQRSPLHHRRTGLRLRLCAHKVCLIPYIKYKNCGKQMSRVGFPHFASY